MRLLFVERCTAVLHRSDELPVATNFRSVAINPHQVRSISLAGNITVPGAGGSKIQDFVKIDTGGHDPIYTIQPMAELVHRWQLACDGFPSEKANDSTGASGSNAMEQLRRNS